MQIDSQNREIRVKYAVLGLPGSGKKQILGEWVKSQTCGEFFRFQVSEAEVIKGTFHWDETPREGWKFQVEVLSTHGWVEYSAIQELLLREMDGLVFVVPVDPSRGEEIRSFFYQIGQLLHRQGRSMRDFPMVIHCHGIEQLPGFQSAMIDDLLGIPSESVFHVETRSDGLGSLTGGFGFLMEKTLRGLEPTFEGNVPDRI